MISKSKIGLSILQLQMAINHDENFRNILRTNIGLLNVHLTAPVYNKFSKNDFNFNQKDQIHWLESGGEHMAECYQFSDFQLSSFSVHSFFQWSNTIHSKFKSKWQICCSRKMAKIFDTGLLLKKLNSP